MARTALFSLQVTLHIRRRHRSLHRLSSVANHYVDGISHDLAGRL
jgi:hypothetical protein